MAGRRISVIDVGSNSVRLLTADLSDGQINELYKDLNTTRLYKDITDDYALNESSMQRTVDAIADYVNLAREKESQEIHIFATAAVRVAKNREYFIQKVTDRTGITLEVITESKEAELAFAGVGAQGLCGVIDIGGASTEIAVGEEGKIISADSAKIGAVKCKELLATDDDTQRMISCIDDILRKDNGETIAFAKAKKNITWYGVGGTITTMGAMLKGLEKYDSRVINETVMKADDVRSMIKKLQGMDAEQRKKLAGLQPRRADIIVYGLAILLSVMQSCNIDVVKASDNDNLTGYIKLMIREK